MKISNWCKLGGGMYRTASDVTSHKEIGQVFVVFTKPDKKRLLVFLDQDEALALGQELVAASRKLGKKKSR